MVNFTFLIFELILADQLSRTTPLQVESSCDEEWQIYISTFTAITGRSTGRSTFPQYSHLVVKHGNFTFLLLKLILADQLEGVPFPSRVISW